jgi:DNA-binding transcriptional LysR family regulator
MSEMVAANLGVTALPESICNRVMNPDIKIIKLRPAILWKLAVITKKDRYISYAGHTLINYIVNEKQFFYHN